jgi:lipid A ethanolaminephosphotransferase
MLYLSDHGESLGEKGLYLHGFPYQIAPEEQTHIPMLFWTSEFGHSKYRECVQQLASTPYSQDNLFDTLLGLSQVNSTVYQPQMDILHECKA